MPPPPARRAAIPALLTVFGCVAGLVLIFRLRTAVNGFLFQLAISDINRPVGVYM